MKVTLEPTSRAKLRKYLVDQFNLSELKDLAFDLGVNYELFSHATLSDFSRELIAYCDRRNQLIQLETAVLEQRPSKDLSQLVGKLPACSSPTKIQIRARPDLLERVSEQLTDLSSKLNVSTDEIELVAMASGSIRLLISLPERLVDLQILSKVILSDHEYQDIVLFDSLDPVRQKAWRLIACNHPPVRQGDILRPTYSWQAAIETIREAQSNFHRASSERLHAQLQHSVARTKAMATLDSNDRAKLRETLEQRFNLEELKTLAFDLGVDYDQLSHARKPELVRELIAYHERQSTLSDLISTAHNRRLDDDDLAQLSAKLQQSAAHATVQSQPPNLPVRNLPYQQNPNFTGREELLTELRDALISGKPAAVVQAIGGLGGVGKTQLALEYAYRHLDDYNVIWWIRAEHANTLASDYASLAGKLGLPGDTIKDQSLVVDIVRHWLETQKNWLLIFDNAAEPADIDPYLPKPVGGHVIITSRRLDWGRLASPLPIETFTSEEALQFLLEHTQQHDAEAAAELAGKLGYLPLALEQARAYMESTQCTLAEYLDRFKHHQLEVLSRGASSPDYPYTVATTWDLSFEQVAIKSPASGDLLNLCAYLAPEDIPLQVLIDGRQFLPERLATAIQDSLRLDEIIEALLKYSLVSRSRGSMAVHRLVRVVIREKVDDKAKRSWASSAVTLINAAFQFDIQDPKTWPTGARLLSHALTAAQHAEDLQTAGEATAHLLNQVGRYLTTRGEYAESEKAFRRALALRESILGENHPDTAESLNDLGWVLDTRGNYADARPYFERAIALREQLLGPNHPDTASSLSNLGGLLHLQGDYGGARSYYERALTIREQAQGPNHPDTASSLGSLGQVLVSQGDFERARSYYERALAIHEQTLGPNHQITGVSLTNLGQLLETQGDYARARSYHERALAIDEQAFGPNHPDIATDLGNLGGVLAEQGDYAGARSYYERALAIFEQTLGPNHTTLAASLNSLGMVYVKQGNYVKARQYFERALTIQETILGKHHPDLAMILNNLGEVLHLQRNLPGARQYFERAVTITRKALGDNHPDLATVLDALGVILVEQGQRVQGQKYLEEALAISRSRLGPNHPTTQQIEANLRPLRVGHGKQQRRKR